MRWVLNIGTLAMMVLGSARAHADDACAKIAETQKASPTASNSLNLGDCYEKHGMTKDALEAYRDALADASAHGRKDLEQAAASKIATLVKEPPKKPDDAPASTAASPPPPPPPPEDPNEGSTQRIAGIVIVGVGGIGLVLGAIAGFVASGELDDAKAKCPSYPTNCSADGSGTAANNRAKTWATLSNIGFIAGGVVAVAGAVIYFTAPRGGLSGRLQIGPMGAWATGTF